MKENKRSPLVAKNKKQFGTFIFLFYFIPSYQKKKKRENQIVSPTGEGEGETEPRSIQSEGGVGGEGSCKKRADK